MNKEHIKISACILSKDDHLLIKECIDNIYPFVDEIIILDANNDKKTEHIIENIKKLSTKPIVLKKTTVSTDLAKDRNELQSIASGDYVLHIDCDERFNTTFLAEMKNIIKSYLDYGTTPMLFRFPRINEPDRINYPDYQIRLLNRNYTIWKGDVHEVPTISICSEIDMINMVTLDYPIIHIYKDKSQLQKRWKSLIEEKPRKKLLLVSIFKNSGLWINDVLKCMSNFYRFNENCDKRYRLDLNFSFVNGQSNDDTFKVLENYVTKRDILNIQLREFEPTIDDDGTDKYVRFKKLAAVRNYIIEQSVSQFSLGDDDYILFIDSDVKFGEHMVHDLIKDLENYKADIIAPLIYIEDFREYGNSYFYDTLAFRDIYGLRFGHVMELNDINTEVPNEISSVGSFYIMKYKVAKSTKYTGNHDSEQAEFCENARSRGFKIFVSPKLSVFHINLDKYGLEWR